MHSGLAVVSDDCTCLMLDGGIHECCKHLRHARHSVSDSPTSLLGQAHYHAVNRERVEAIMAHLIRVGRLQQLPEHPSMVCMGGLLKQLKDQPDAHALQRVEPLEHNNEVGNLLISHSCCQFHKGCTGIIAHPVPCHWITVHVLLSCTSQALAEGIL